MYSAPDTSELTMKDVEDIVKGKAVEILRENKEPMTIYDRFTCVGGGATQVNISLFGDYPVHCVAIICITIMVVVAILYT